MFLKSSKHRIFLGLAKQIDFKINILPRPVCFLHSSFRRFAYSRKDGQAELTWVAGNVYIYHTGS